MSSLQLDDRGVLTTCPQCGRTNRLGYPRLDKSARCGACGVSLTGPDSPIEVPSVAAFDALIRSSALPVVVDFWAPWCGPCRMVAPELEKVARRTAGSYLIVKVNTESLTELGERFRIRSIPMMAVFRGGEEVARSAGARPADAILELVRNALQLQPGR